MLFSRTTPLSPNWTLDFEPAFSPRFSPTLSPRSFFPTRQRFPISNHVTSGCMSPPSHLDHWSAVTPTGNDMTSLICSRPIRSQSESHTSVLYYFQCFNAFQAFHFIQQSYYTMFYSLSLVLHLG